MDAAALRIGVRQWRRRLGWFPMLAFAYAALSFFGTVLEQTPGGQSTLGYFLGRDAGVHYSPLGWLVLASLAAVAVDVLLRLAGVLLPRPTTPP